MTYAIMSNTDYEGICDTVRAKTETTALLKSAEVAPAIRSIELGGTSFTLTVTTEAGATVTATKGGTSVSAVATDGTAVLKLKETGDWTVTAQLNGETSSPVVVSVTDSYEITFRYLPPIGTALNDMTWEQISKIAKAGLAEQYFSVGDRKEVVLNGAVGDGLTLSDYTAYCYIIGINHNAELEGNNLIHFQFLFGALSGGKDLAFVDASYNSTTSNSRLKMNDGRDNTGGWNSSFMRTAICPAFKNTMPSDLQTVLAPVVKYTDNTGGGSDTASYVTATSEEVFLLAEWEVFGARTHANSAEQNYQAQYAWYSAGNSNVRYRHSDTSSTAYWWLRSVRAALSAYFCLVRPTGESYWRYSNYSCGFSPCFCVGGV